MSKRLEAALVRKLEIARLHGSQIPLLKHASPYQWANACHDLWEAGRIEVVEYASRRLYKRYPGLDYLQTLVTLLDRMPRELPGPLPFHNDPAAEIQIVRRPDCEAVLLCFCAQQGTLGLPVNFVHQWLGRLPVSLVYIKDPRRVYGAEGFAPLGPDRESAVVGLRRIATELGGRRIYVLGVSVGGFPALYYGLRLDAAAVLSLAGPTDLTPAFVDSLGRVGPGRIAIRPKAPDYATNLRNLFVSRSIPRVLIVYGDGNFEDRCQAEQLAGQPNVSLIALKYGGHNVIEPLVRQEMFMPLLYRLLS